MAGVDGSIKRLGLSRQRAGGTWTGHHLRGRPRFPSVLARHAAVVPQRRALRSQLPPVRSWGSMENRDAADKPAAFPFRHLRCRSDLSAPVEGLFANGLGLVAGGGAAVVTAGNAAAIVRSLVADVAALGVSGRRNAAVAGSRRLAG